jgi:hypothetical protein
MAARDQAQRFRVVARKDSERVRLYSRPGNDLTYRFPLIVEALTRLRARSCVIDGEAVCCGDGGVPSFDRIRYRRHDASVFLYAFDLIELNGYDLRHDPLEARKATLASALAKAAPGLRLNKHIDADGPKTFDAADPGPSFGGYFAFFDEAINHSGRDERARVAIGMAVKKGAPKPRYQHGRRVQAHVGQRENDFSFCRGCQRGLFEDPPRDALICQVSYWRHDSDEPITAAYVRSLG